MIYHLKNESVIERSEVRMKRSKTNVKANFRSNLLDEPMVLITFDTSSSNSCTLFWWFRQFTTNFNYRQHTSSPEGLLLRNYIFPRHTTWCRFCSFTSVGKSNSEINLITTRMAGMANSIHNWQTKIITNSLS